MSPFPLTLKYSNIASHNCGCPRTGALGDARAKEEATSPCARFRVGKTPRSLTRNGCSNRSGCAPPLNLKTPAPHARHYAHTCAPFHPCFGGVATKIHTRRRRQGGQPVALHESEPKWWRCLRARFRPLRSVSQSCRRNFHAFMTLRCGQRECMCYRCLALAARRRGVRGGSAAPSSEVNPLSHRFRFLMSNCLA